MELGGKFKMKVMKELFLSSAAGLIAVASGQTAELPVKAQPVQYLKVCSIYGAGFYYMPGTDTCLKIGGYVRVELTDPSSGALIGNPFAGNENNRTNNNLTAYARGYITADAREQTAYGVARGYISVGLSLSDFGTLGSEGFNTASANRAFVQWAGVTAGLGRSFYDFYNTTNVSYRGAYMAVADTGVGGWWTWAYTANFGDGFSATLSAEKRRMTQITGQSTADGVIGANALVGQLSGWGYGGWQIPDIVANLRIDQAWGSGQLMSALHQVNATYYGSPTVSESNGYPADAWGWAVGAGLHLNTPVFGIADYFEGQVSYSQGAAWYNLMSGFQYSNQDLTFSRGASQGFAINSDCVYGGSIIGGAATGTNCLLTTSWSAVLAYEHFWTPQWHQSFSGAYAAESYGANANAILCSLEHGGNGVGIGTTALATPGCNNNWAYWTVGSRLQWDITESFYIGVELLYLNLISAQTFNGIIPNSLTATFFGSPSVCGNGTTCTVGNQSDWAFTLRMHKDFLP
jgi:hypothetical protein